MIELPVIEGAPQAQDADAHGPKLWRSFSHLKKAPGFEEITREEFLPGASNSPGKASRRQFMQLMGASMALAGLTACRKPYEKILPYTRKPEEIVEGIALEYATAMPFRGHVRPIVVESHEGRPTKIEGNAEHPMSQGASGVFEQASVLTLYDPDRSKYVRRDGIDATWRDFANYARSLSTGAATRGIAVLSSISSSPTERAMQQRLQQRFPGLQWVTYDALGEDNVALGLQQATGRLALPLYQFAEAQVIVSLDADFLSHADRNSLHNNRTFAASRRRVDDDGTMSRLYAVESNFSITGSMADNRLRLRSSDMPAFAAAVAARLGVGGGGDATFVGHPWVDAIAADLQQAGANGVILAGEHQPPAVHALCMAINSSLGSVGQTVELMDQQRQIQDPEAFERLVNQMNSGQIDTLFILNCNPAYDAPGDLDFVQALERVQETIHLGLYRDETAEACRWHLPASHYLEMWSDGRAYDGTLSVIQPLIAPLYDTKSDLEVLNLLATGRDVSGYDLVRQTWQQAGAISGDFEKGWRRVLHDGFVPNSAYPTFSGGVAAPALGSLPPASTNDLELVIRHDPTVLDGSYANNTWLQETPDPLTKIVWDNVAVMSPATAEALGVDYHDPEGGRYYVAMLTISAAGRDIEIPAWVMPGIADNSIQLTTGYGRNIVSLREIRDTNFFDTDDYTDVYGQGAIATGVGVSVAPLQTQAAPTVIRNAEVRVTGDGYMIATTQDHGVIEEEREEVASRGLFRMATVEEYRANPNFVKDGDPPEINDIPWAEYPTLWQKRHPTNDDFYKDNPYYKNQWGMVIDLNTCTGCNACMVACQSENNIQVVGKEEVARGREMHWIRMDRYFLSTEDQADDPMMVMQPVPCMHCENAPCESVCPVAATVHSPDGTNQMIYNRCIGTRYCANNCPYKVRRFNFYNWTHTLPTTVGLAMNPHVTVRSRGVMEKCSYCIQRVRTANKRANIEKRGLRDGEVVTACQQACPAQAITFGDLADPDTAISQLSVNPRRYQMLAELNVKPRTQYLGRVRNPNPALEVTEVAL